MQRITTATAAWGLRVAAVASLAMALLWALGPNGTDSADLVDLPGTERLTTSEALSGWATAPRAAVDLRPVPDDRPAWISVRPDSVPEGSPTPDGYAELRIGPGVQLWDPSRAQQLVFVALQVLTWLTIAGLWWMLAAMAASMGRRTPFTTSNARRLTVAGVVLLVGGLVHSIAGHVVLSRMVESSSLADRVRPVPYGLLDLPWGTLAVGAAVLAVGLVWRHGVTLAADVEDLV